MKGGAGPRALAGLEDLLRRQEEALAGDDPGALLEALRDGAGAMRAVPAGSGGGPGPDGQLIEALLARSREVEARCRDLRARTLSLLDRSGAAGSAERAYARSAGDDVLPGDLDLRL